MTRSYSRSIQPPITVSSAQGKTCWKLPTACCRSSSSLSATADELLEVAEAGDLLEVAEPSVVNGWPPASIVCAVPVKVRIELSVANQRAESPRALGLGVVQVLEPEERVVDPAVLVAQVADQTEREGVARHRHVDHRRCRTSSRRRRWCSSRRRRTCRRGRRDRRDWSGDGWRRPSTTRRRACPAGRAGSRRARRRTA